MVRQSLRASQSKTIENILEKAYSDHRKRLYEHEVYQILSALDLATPTHLFVTDEEEITNHSLSVFSTDKIVLKIVSRDIVHKHKSGGVKVVLKDLDFVRYSFRNMKKKFKGAKERTDGILFVEYIDYSKDLGNEILLGFRESDSFGPVISFSKGGTDAEHFASNFSAPNLILPPINREWACALQSSTRIQKKYIDEEKQHYIPKIVDTEVKFSDLATCFSNFFDSPSRFALKEFEINPFVFDDDGNFIAIDGFATFEKKDKRPPDLQVRPKHTLKSLFEPRGIAVVGTSTLDDTKTGNIIVKNLVGMQRDDLYCVNIKGGALKVAGRSFEVYRSVRDISREVELAIITVPAEAIVSIVEDCALKGVKSIILIPGGFSEIQKNREVEKKILQIARKNGIRLVGPNCLGILYAGDGGIKGINSFFVPEEKFSVNLEKEKKVAILSQSGALGITEIYNLRNAISPKVIVSYGNQLDVDPSDLVQYFEDDPVVDVIGLYIEGFKKGAGRKFFNTTAQSVMPIIVYKAGRTEEGKKAAQSHTASIAGEYEVARAAMKQAGLIVADSMIDHGDFIKTFALLQEYTVSGNRLAVIANAGYEKTYAADNLGDLELADLDPLTIRKLNKIIPPFVRADPLLDLTAMASDEMFESCIDILLASDRVDALCISIVPQAQVIHTTDDEIDHYKANVAARIVSTVQRWGKPTVVSVNVASGADATYNKFGQVMDSGGVPTFLTAERAMICLNEFIRYKLIREKNVFSEWLK
jgi:acyl-CoA synthetase (NDP forming)